MITGTLVLPIDDNLRNLFHKLNLTSSKDKLYFFTLLLGAITNDNFIFTDIVRIVKIFDRPRQARLVYNYVKNYLKPILKSYNVNNVVDIVINKNLIIIKHINSVRR